MALLAIWSWVPDTLNVLVVILGIFLILLVLIQRGKGGGLSGAFGGVGGSSAFGSRAGGLFMWITLGVFGAWIILTMAEVWTVQEYVRTNAGSVSSDYGSDVPNP